MPSPTLDSLGVKHGTNQASSGRGYLEFYQRFLVEIRERPMRVLDIGVQGGASARMWEEFFPNAKIIAVDINPDCRQYAGGRIAVEILDQSNTVALAQLARNHGPFGLIVDDGSHVWNHQITSLQHLYPHLEPGGYYIVEDLHTSYGDQSLAFRGTARVSTAAYLQGFAEQIAARDRLRPADTDDPFIISCTKITEFVAFGRRTAVLRRRADQSASR